MAVVVLELGIGMMIPQSETMTMWFSFTFEMRQISPNKSLQAIPTNYIGTFSGLDGIQPAGLELRKFSRASVFGISRLRRDSRPLVPSTLRPAVRDYGGRACLSSER